MENKEIIRLLRRTASLMEIAGANEFKVRAINNGIFNLERIEGKLETMTPAELQELNGIGKSIAEQIAEIIAENESSELRRLTAEIPKGVVEMLNISGIGAKKIRMLWQEENITSPIRLRKAINEGRLQKLKGFGDKTVRKISESLEYYLNSQHKMLISDALKLNMEVLNLLRSACPGIRIETTGALRRKEQVIEELFYIAEDRSDPFEHFNTIDGLSYDPAISSPFNWRGIHKETGMHVCIRKVPENHFASRFFFTTGPMNHISELGMFQDLQTDEFTSEEEIYKKAGKPFIPADIRIAKGVLDMEETKLDSLITDKDIRGILHCHSTYSDGQNSIREMVDACRSRGYEYLGLTDHSKSSFFYANGLFENRIREQFQEIDEIQRELNDFRIFRGIECDILSDGSLDYDPDVLEEFDFIIISVHSVLNMDIKTATARLVKAIENPYSTILGHLTGRLLLRRPGYPLHMPTILDACQQNNVSIEINANPRRLDIDWTFLPEVLKRDIRVSINPDAHNINGFADVSYGVMAARKGLVSKEDNLTSLSATDLEMFFRSRKKTQLSNA
ncbi:MAG: PHP domain-containing protein [Cyclobacteriaceae bacterium]